MTNTPRICPVNGMFLDEPEYGRICWMVTSSGEVRKHVYGRESSYQKFLIGNLFSHKEHAERYAKHLKAMAKERRELANDTYNMTQDDLDAKRWPFETKRPTVAE